MLMNEGIPAFAQTRTGYFNTVEVETVLSLLSVVDNPMQDIPLAAVMRSPIVGTVSYTHLDVYKRQVQAGGAVPDARQGGGMYGYH